MNNKDFAKVAEKQVNTCWNVLCDKSPEYDFGEDKFRNFKKASALLGISQEEVLLGYLTKHIISLCDMIPKANDFTEDKFEEKITDTINYLLLLKGMLAERYEEM